LFLALSVSLFSFLDTMNWATLLCHALLTMIFRLARGPQQWSKLTMNWNLQCLSQNKYFLPLGCLCQLFCQGNEKLTNIPSRTSLLSNGTTLGTKPLTHRPLVDISKPSQHLISKSPHSNVCYHGYQLRSCLHQPWMHNSSKQCLGSSLFLVYNYLINAYRLVPLGERPEQCLLYMFVMVL
jgi:hypothetical protein